VREKVAKRRTRDRDGATSSGEVFGIGGALPLPACGERAGVRGNLKGLSL
jgi:hypothetical protein